MSSHAEQVVTVLRAARSSTSIASGSLVCESFSVWGHDGAKSAIVAVFQVALEVLMQKPFSFSLSDLVTFYASEPQH